ncbi:hypothetical protein GOBAR_DD30764 [Gossypium barbadense]|nr:hypothetical protein GOBAR_DD30764 [Gossypium barbadense]
MAWILSPIASLLLLNALLFLLLLVCLRMLMRKCVYENISKGDIQKLFPSEVLPKLERLLTLLLQKFQREWRADVHMDKVRNFILLYLRNIYPKFSWIMDGIGFFATLKDNGLEFAMDAFMLQIGDFHMYGIGLTAGILWLLKLEKSHGKEAMNKFSYLGIEGFEKIFSSDKLSQGSKLRSITTLALLAEAVSDSQAKCAALITESSNSESSQVNLTTIKELKQKLDNMHSLLLQLRVQI